MPELIDCVRCCEIFGDLFAAEIDLIRDRVFAEDVGQALDFAGGGREEGEPDAGFEQRFGFADGDLEVAVEGHRGAGGNVESVFPVVALRFAEIELADFEDVLRGGEFANRSQSSMADAGSICAACVGCAQPSPEAFRRRLRSAPVRRSG